MPDIINVAILAIVQGLTEFLPVSSSGHLALMSHMLNFQSPGILLEVLLHFGTLLAVLIYYRKKLGELCVGVLRREAQAWHFAGAVAITMIPAVIVGLCYEERLSAISENPRAVAGLLLVTGTILLATRFISGDKPKVTVKEPHLIAEEKITWWRAVLVGLAQAFAVLPGISRSGMTISMARFTKLSPELAAEFSFIMVIPVIAGATLLKVIEAFEMKEWCLSMGQVIVGLTLSAIVGYLSIAFMVKLLNRDRFWLFGIYAWIVGLAFILYL